MDSDHANIEIMKTLEYLFLIENSDTKMIIHEAHLLLKNPEINLSKTYPCSFVFLNRISRINKYNNTLCYTAISAIKF